MDCLKCPYCTHPLERQYAKCGDPVAWCATCARGWLPGTGGFDRLLEAQRTVLQQDQPSLWMFSATVGGIPLTEPTPQAN